MATPQHRENVGKRKINAPPGFEWFRWEVIGPDATKLTGCISTGTYKKGPQKGRPKYDGPRQEVVVTNAEEAAELDRYEADTGRCGRCLGDGQVLAAWNHLTGVSWKQC